MSLGPAEGKEGSGLGLAGLEGDAVPAQFAAEADVLPVMGALVHEEGFPASHRVNVDAMSLEIIGEGLLDVQNAGVGGGLVSLELIEDIVHVGRILTAEIDPRTFGGLK